MFPYVAGRLIESIVVLLVVSFCVYGLIGLMPGDPIDLMIQGDPNLTPADAKRLKALYGLDQPIIDRYTGTLSVMRVVSGTVRPDSIVTNPGA